MTCPNFRAQTQKLRWYNYQKNIWSMVMLSVKSCMLNSRMAKYLMKDNWERWICDFITRSHDNKWTVTLNSPIFHRCVDLPTLSKTISLWIWVEVSKASVDVGISAKRKSYENGFNGREWVVCYFIYIFEWNIPALFCFAYLHSKVVPSGKECFLIVTIDVDK